MTGSTYTKLCHCDALFRILFEKSFQYVRKRRIFILWDLRLVRLDRVVHVQHGRAIKRNPAVAEAV